MRTARVAACILIAGLAGTSRADDQPSGADTNGPTVAVQESEKALAREHLEKPAEFERWADRLDFIENNFTYGLQTGVSRVDSYFGGNAPTSRDVQPTSSLRLGMYVAAEEDAGLNLRFNPDYDASVRLPNLEQNWRVFVTGKEIGEAPDTDPTERERGVQIGIRRVLDKYYLRVDAGVKVSWPPELFVRGKWTPKWSVKDWRFHPAQEVFWDTDERFGELTSYDIFKWLGNKRIYLFALTGSGKWTEETRGVELRQSVKLVRVTEMIEEKSRGRNMADRDLARGVALRYTISGHADSSKIIDRHRLTLGYRRPLYKKWLYLDVAPELQWRNDSDWKTVPILRIGVEALFWGFGRT